MKKKTRGKVSSARIPALIDKAIESRAWLLVPPDRRITATGGSMSSMALNMALVELERAVDDVDCVVVGYELFGDIRTWNLLQDGRLWGIRVVRDKRIPSNLALVCSFRREGAFSSVEVVVGS